MSLLSTPSFESETTVESNFATAEVRRFERESYQTTNNAIGQSQLIDQLIFTQLHFGHSSRTVNNAIEYCTTQVRGSISSSVENAILGSDAERNCSFSDVSTTEYLIAKQSKKKVILLAFSCFLLPVLSCLITMLVFWPRNENFCNSYTCLLESVKTTGKMDREVEPCTDFYARVCGNLEKETPIPRDKTGITSLSAAQSEMEDQLKTLLSGPIEKADSEPLRNAKKLYAACNNEDVIESTGKEELLRLVRFNPVLGMEKWSEYLPRWEWQKFDAQSYLYGMSGPYFMSFGFALDPRNSSNRIFKIGSPSLTLDRETLLGDVNGTLLRAYYDYQVDISELLGAKFEKAKVLMGSVLKFEIELAKISVEANETSTIDIGIQSIGSLNRIYPYNDWLKYFQRLLPDEKISKYTRVKVETPTYFENLGKLLRRTDKRTYITYGFWRITADAIDYLPSSVKGRHQEYLRQTTGITISEERWKKCIDITIDYFPAAVSALYASQRLIEDTELDAIKEKIAEIVGNLKTAVKEMIQQADWMDDETKLVSDKKIETMNVMVGFPKDSVEVQALESSEKMSFKLDIKADKLYETTRILNIAFRTHLMRKTMDIDENDGVSKLLLSFNAKYTPDDNTITIPIVLLRHFFKDDRPNYKNYGEIGSVLARKMIRAISDLNEWTNATRSNYAEKAKCVVELYGNFTDRTTKEKYEAKRTLAENIVDIGGLKAAYQAYELWSKTRHTDTIHPGVDFNQKQMFWVSAAQVWCSAHREQSMKEIVLKGSKAPDRLRTLGSLMTYEQFAKDFECESGSPMNPVIKCTVW